MPLLVTLLIFICDRRGGGVRAGMKLYVQPEGSHGARGRRHRAR